MALRVYGVLVSWQPAPSCNPVTVTVLPVATLSTLQVYAAPTCFIFDLVTDDSSVKGALISTLGKILEDDRTMKLMHDCCRPAAALHYQLQINICNVFDTQARPRSHCDDDSCTYAS